MIFMRKRVKVSTYTAVILSELLNTISTKQNRIKQSKRLLILDCTLAVPDLKHSWVLLMHNGKFISLHQSMHTLCRPQSLSPPPKTCLQLEFLNVLQTMIFSKSFTSNANIPFSILPRLTLG